MKHLASIALVALALAGLFLFVRSGGPGGDSAALLPDVPTQAPAARAQAGAELRPETSAALAYAVHVDASPRGDAGRAEVVRRVRVKALVLSESSIYAKRLVGVSVAFGVAFRDGRDRPLEGQLVLGHGVSDAAGRIEVDLTVPAGLPRPCADLVVFGRPSGVSFQQREAAMPLAEEGDIELELTVIAEVGGTVSGRVVDALGEPLAVHMSLVKSKPARRSCPRSTGGSRIRHGVPLARVRMPSVSFACTSARPDASACLQSGPSLGRG